jgi:transposase-like protein
MYYSHCCPHCNSGATVLFGRAAGDDSKFRYFCYRCRSTFFFRTPHAASPTREPYTLAGLIDKHPSNYPVLGV